MCIFFVRSMRFSDVVLLSLDRQFEDDNGDPRDRGKIAGIMLKQSITLDFIMRTESTNLIEKVEANHFYIFAATRF